MKKIVSLITVLLILVCLAASCDSAVGSGDSLNQNNNNTNSADDMLISVMPDGNGFEEISASEFEISDAIKRVWRETDNKGYVIEVEGRGFNKGMIILVGISPDGVITGAKCTASNETYGAEKSFGDSLVGKDIDTLSEVNIVAGATMTSSGYRNAVREALNAFAIITGKN